MVPFMPEPYAEWDAKRAMRPPQQDERGPIYGLVHLALEDPGQALHRGGKSLRNNRVVENKIPLLPDEKHADGESQACVPRPTALQHPPPSIRLAFLDENIVAHV
jgi:hypothetical protein